MPGSTYEASALLSCCDVAAGWGGQGPSSLPSQGDLPQVGSASLWCPQVQSQPVGVPECYHSLWLSLQCQPVTFLIQSQLVGIPSCKHRLWASLGAITA